MNLTIPAFVINLERRPDRLALFKSRCPLEHVRIIKAFDAKNHENESPEDIKFFNKVQCTFPGEAAVYVSHIRILKEIIESGYQHALIFEDDAEFCEGFMEKYQRVLKDIPEDTSLLYIGGRFTPSHRMKDVNCSRVTPMIVKHKGARDAWDTDRTAHAYIVSAKGATLLIDYFNSLEKITRPIDDLMLNYFLERDLSIYSSMPLLCHSPAIGDSDIRRSVSFSNRRLLRIQRG